MSSWVWWWSTQKQPALLIKKNSLTVKWIAVTQFASLIVISEPLRSLMICQKSRCCPNISSATVLSSVTVTGHEQQNVHWNKKFANLSSRIRQIFVWRSSHKNSSSLNLTREIQGTPRSSLLMLYKRYSILLSLRETLICFICQGIDHLILQSDREAT